MLGRACRTTTSPLLTCGCPEGLLVPGTGSRAQIPESGLLGPLLLLPDVWVKSSRFSQFSALKCCFLLPSAERFLPALSCDLCGSLVCSPTSRRRMTFRAAGNDSWVFAMTTRSGSNLRLCVHQDGADCCLSSPFTRRRPSLACVSPSHAHALCTSWLISWLSPLEVRWCQRGRSSSHMIQCSFSHRLHCARQ